MDLQTLLQGNQPNLIDQADQLAHNSYQNNQSMNSQTSGAPLSTLDQLNQPQHVATSVGTPDKGNWFTHLLPTILGTGGAILGGLVPGLGETGVSEVAGGSLGSGAGKALQNILEGNQDVGQGVGGEAALGALGGGLGKAAEAGIGGVGRVIAGTGERGLAKQAETQGAENALKDVQETRNNFGPVDKNIKQGTNPNQTLKGAQDLAKEIQINHNDPQAFVTSADAALSPLGDFRKDVLSRGGPINTAGVIGENGEKVAPGVQDIIEGALKNTHPTTGESLGQDLSTVLGPTDKIAIKKGQLGLPNNQSTQFMTQAQQILDKANGSNVDPQALLDASVQIGKNAQAARQLAAKTATSDITGVNAAKAQAWQNLDQEVNRMLLERPSVDKAVSETAGNFTPEDVGGHAPLADAINSRLTQAQSGKDLNGIMSQFMNLNTQGKAALSAAGDTSSAAAVNAAKMALPETEGGAAANLGSNLGNAVASSNHPIGKLLGSVLNIGSKGGVPGKVASGLGSTLQRIAPIAGMGAGEVVTNSPNSVSTGANADTAIAGGVPQTGPASTGNAMQDIMNSQSPLSLALKYDIINNEHPYVGQNVGLSDAGAASIPLLAKVNSAQAQLAQLENTFNQAGGAQGPVQGLLSQLGSHFTGGPAAHYQDQANQLAQTIEALTGTRVNTPSLTMNQQSANSVLGQLQAALSAYSGGTLNSLPGAAQ